MGCLAPARQKHPRKQGQFASRQNRQQDNAGGNSFSENKAVPSAVKVSGKRWHRMNIGLTLK
jgi:hypothetical protein